MFILLDIDHTIANSFWRDSMIGNVPWDDYHAASKDDKPFKNVADFINALYAMGYSIVGTTGRTENFRALTLKWFLKHRINIDELLMRPEGDFTKNAELKISLVNRRFDGKYKDILFAIDDNEDACIAYMNIGITSLQIRNIK